MTISIILLIVGLIILIKGADIFIDSGVAIAKIFKISEIIIGLTFVCFGTSLPELIMSLMGSVRGTQSLVIGHMVGASMFNICIILGIVCLIHPVKFLRATVRKDMYMSLLTSIAIFVLLLDKFLNGSSFNIISRTDGIIMLLFFGVFMYYTFYEFGKYMKDKNAKKSQEEIEEDQKIIVDNKDVLNIFKNIALATLAIIMIWVGSQLVLNNAISIAVRIGVSQSLMAIAIIAPCTSLPEITTSIIAIKKKRSNIAIGNLIGSTMFNLLFILGVSALIKPINLGMDLILIDIVILIFVGSILVISTRKTPDMSKKEGLILLATYISYIVFVLYRG